MEAAKQQDTAPEVALRSALHQLGLRYRINVSPIPGMRRRADVVFPKARVAVYVHGCFWHGCPIHATWPKANAGFWRDKIESNRRRDADTDRALAAVGWLPIPIWEHEDPGAASEHIAIAVRERSRRSDKPPADDTEIGAAAPEAVALSDPEH